MSANLIDSRIQQGKDLLNRGAVQEAYQEFSAAHALDVQHVDALYYLWAIDCQAANYVAAEVRANNILAQYPDDASALNLLGSALMHQEKYDAARDAFNKGIELDVADAALYNNLAICLCWEQKYGEAIEACRKALDIKPDYAVSHNIMGNVWHGWEKPDQALECYRRAVQIEPDFIDAHMNIGRAYHELGNLNQALSAYSHVIKNQPQRADVWVRCGDIHRARQDEDKAIEAYKVALSIQPDNAAALTSLGNLVMKHRFYPQAEAHYRKALASQPGNIEANLHLGVALRSQQKYRDAAACFRKVLELAPGHFQANFFLAALEDTELPPVAHPVYVRGLFDEYAENFDRTLIEKLEYRVPEKFAEVVPEFISPENLSVMDLGCGTGLCGPLFRSCASRLVGVDLSSRMLEKAAERKVYDELITGEIVEILEDHSADVDLMLAADVLIYIGDLLPLFRAVSGALKPGGVFAFSIELLEDIGFMYSLCPESRYTHSSGYVRALADGQKFLILHIEEQTIRKEYDQAVPGLIVVLQK